MAITGQPFMGIHDWVSGTQDGEGLRETRRRREAVAGRAQSGRRGGVCVAVDLATCLLPTNPQSPAIDPLALTSRWRRARTSTVTIPCLTHAQACEYALRGMV